jgi:hypothetical protein
MGTGRIFRFSQSHPLLRGICCDSVIAPQRACTGSRPTPSARGTVTRAVLVHRKSHFTLSFKLHPCTIPSGPTRAVSTCLKARQEWRAPNADLKRRAAHAARLHARQPTRLPENAKVAESAGCYLEEEFLPALCLLGPWFWWVDCFFSCG